MTVTCPSSKINIQNTSNDTNKYLQNKTIATKLHLSLITKLNIDRKFGHSLNTGDTLPHLPK